MTYAQIIKAFEKTIPVFVQMYNENCMYVKRDAKGTHIMARYPREQKAFEFMKSLDDAEFMVKLECFICMKVLGAGPKIFRPTSEQLFALERMKLNLEVTDFKMPYETIVVELPDEYRLVRNPEAHCSILHFEPKVPFITHTALYTSTTYKTWWSPKPDVTLEEWFLQEHPFEAEDSLSLQEHEIEMEESLRRAVMNYCLLLDEVGTKREGPAVPNQYSQLVKWCAKKNEHTALNRKQLQAQPIVYSIKAPTNLVRVVGSHRELGESTDRILSPHSRRGYYKMQPYGPGNKERKRIRIPPCIVNSHLLTGPLEKIYVS